MKASVTISSVAHVAVLSWGLLNLSAPEPMVIDLGTNTIIDVESSEESQIAQGEKQAELNETPAPEPTKNPEIVPDAQNVGDSSNDERSENDGAAAERVVETAATSEQADENSPDPDQKPKAEEQPTPATELAAVNDPATPIVQETPSEEPEISEASEQIASLPDVIPVPVTKPTPPKPNTAKTTERKQPDQKPSQQADNAAKGEKDNKKDPIRNLLTTEDAASTGAKRSTQTASLGTKSANLSEKLSRREVDAFVQSISRCSTGQAGRVISPDLKITVELQLLPNGDLAVEPRAAPRGGTQEERNRYVRDVLRYVVRCAPYDMLPKDKYDTWAEVQVTFHVADMFQ